MARYWLRRRGREQVWEYYLWPLMIGTPHWFDNDQAAYRPGNSRLDLVWAYLRSWGVIRLRCTHCRRAMRWSDAASAHDRCGQPDPRRGPPDVAGSRA